MMSFDFIGPSKIVAVQFMYREFFRLPEEYGLACPIIQRLRNAHDRVQDVVIAWDSGEIEQLQEELRQIREEYERRTPRDSWGYEEHNALIVGIEICQEVLSKQGKFVFRWG